MLEKRPNPEVAIDYGKTVPDYFNMCGPQHLYQNLSYNCMCSSSVCRLCHGLGPFIQLYVLFFCMPFVSWFRTTLVGSEGSNYYNNNGRLSDGGPGKGNSAMTTNHARALLLYAVCVMVWPCWKTSKF